MLVRIKKNGGGALGNKEGHLPFIAECCHYADGSDVQLRRQTTKACWCLVRGYGRNY